MLSALLADLCFDAFDEQVGLVGHSHVASSFTRPEGEPATGSSRRADDVADLAAGRWLLNPGSVGQPRDGDPRASYMLVDLESMSFELRRVEYPIARTQARMRESALPNRLITRLELGW